MKDMSIRLSKKWSEMRVIDFIRAFEDAGLRIYARGINYLTPEDVILRADEAMSNAPASRSRNSGRSKRTKRKATRVSRKNP